MSIISRVRRKQRRNFDSMRRLNVGLIREIGDWRLIDIHEIPQKIDYNHEFDFWCHNHRDLFLLRLRKARKEKCFITKSKGRDSVIYLIAEFDFENINHIEIKGVLDRFELWGIPCFSLASINVEFST